MRRTAAIVLPELACEIVRQRAFVSGPLGVIFEEVAGDTQAKAMTAKLDAVSEEARRLGVRPGQSVVEASALAARLAVHRVTFEEIEHALGSVAEIALALGPMASLSLAPGSAFAKAVGSDLDTVWLNITGAAHLVGGEGPLLSRLLERVAELGYVARAAISDGPIIAQALARWGAPSRGQSHPIANEGEGAIALATLPVQALPLGDDVLRFLLQLGIRTAGDLTRLPSSAVSARLGPSAPLVMSLLRGVDDAALEAYEPPRAFFEEISFEEGVSSNESLLFVLRGMTSRLGARLGALGEACSAIDVTIAYDRSIARLRSKAKSSGSTSAEEPDDFALNLRVDLPAPIAAPADLFRAIRTKLERAELAAPAVGLRLELSQIAPARSVQLDLSRDVAVDPDRLPALLAELSAEIGPERLGTLAIVDAHRPEARSRLSLAETSQARGLADPLLDEDAGGPSDPTRLLPEPVPLGRVHQGAVVVIEGRRYVIERLTFEMRLHAVEWWTSSPTSRDYARAWLVERQEPQVNTRGRRGPSGGAPMDPSSCARTCGEALLFVDRATGEGYLQGWRE